MITSNWVAIKLVTEGKGLKNFWVCKACPKCCTATLPLSEEPNRKCGGGEL